MAGVMGYEPDKMSDDQLKKEIDYWKNTANGQRPGSLQRLQSDAKSQAAKQELEKRQNGGGKEPEEEQPKTPEVPKKEEPPVTPNKQISGKDVYKNLPKESSPEAMRKRQEAFRPYEDKNMEVGKLREQANDIKYRLNLWESIKNEKTDPKEIAGIEDNLKKWTAEREDILNKKVKLENELGDKLEPVEVQNLLKRREGYLEDQKRRKEGSNAWSDNDVFAKITDKQIDKFRSGVDFGHNQQEWEEERAVARKESDAQYEKQKAEQQVKDSKKLQKSNDTIDQSRKILKDHGIDTEKFDLTGPI